MVKEQDTRNTHRIYENDKAGEVQIADEVVSIIAGFEDNVFSFGRFYWVFWDMVSGSWGRVVW